MTTLNDYLNQRVPSGALSAKEAKVVGIGWPLPGGWRFKKGGMVLTDAHLEALKDAYVSMLDRREKGKQQKENHKANVLRKQMKKAELAPLESRYMSLLNHYGQFGMSGMEALLQTHYQELHKK